MVATPERRQRARNADTPGISSVGAEHGSRVELDGVEAYHLSGKSTRYEYVDAYGAGYERDLVTLTISNDPTLPETERLEIVDSALASYSWR